MLSDQPETITFSVTTQKLGKVTRSAPDQQVQGAFVLQGVHRAKLVLRRGVEIVHEQVCEVPDFVPDPDAFLQMELGMALGEALGKLLGVDLSGVPQ